MTQVTVSETTIAQQIDSYFAAICNMDLEAWIATFAEDAMMYDPVTHPPFCGHEGIRQFFLAIAPMLEAIEIKPEFVHAIGNEVAVKWLGRAVGKNGREVRFDGIDLFEMNDTGEIQKLRGYWDQNAFLTQLQS